MPRLGILLSIAFLAILVIAAQVRAALPTGVTLKTFYDTAAIKFTEPVWFGQYPGKRGAFMVGELGGNIFLLEPVGAGYQKTLFVQIPVTKISGNDGLLGIAFHPGFKTNRKYYVYSIPVLGQGLLTERQAKASFAADSGITRSILLSTFGNQVHNGGDVHFGPDGYLYLGFGDAGNPNVYNTRARDLSLFPGKMIRIDVNAQDPGKQYAIPPDNPFAGSTDTSIRKEIWAYGLRQPWRWTFDPLNGRLFVADVGDWVQEEIDTITKGGDYGWSVREGNTCFNSALEYSPLASCDTTGIRGPIAVYTHNPITVQGNACVVGGAIFRGNPASGAYGAYIFGDYVTRELFAALPVSPGVTQMAVIGTSHTGMGSFGTDSLGNIYMVAYAAGVIFRLDHADLAGTVTALQSPIGAREPRIRATMRMGAKAMFAEAERRGMDRLRITGIDGRTRLVLARTQFDQALAVEPGVYTVEGIGEFGRGGARAFTVLLP